MTNILGFTGDLVWWPQNRLILYSITNRRVQSCDQTRRWIEHSSAPLWRISWSASRANSRSINLPKWPSVTLEPSNVWSTLIGRLGVPWRNDQETENKKYWHQQSLRYVYPSQCSFIIDQSELTLTVHWSICGKASGLYAVRDSRPPLRKIWS